jgi:ribonucleoside-diphosphate reductase alpha chain
MTAPLAQSAVSPIAMQIWDMKYRLKGPDGVVSDKTVDDSWRRVAGALAQAEAPAERAQWTQNFYEALSDYKFLPAGRILAGAGSGRDVTLFNCFVMGRIPDNLEGIFENLKEAALTMQQGGGIGYDFSTIRPKGAPVKGVGADASGPLSFMDVWDAMCRTIMSAGYRRGAMMATLRCDHPDIEAFIEAKREPGRLRMFNLSVLATDGFMAAVKNDKPWDLVFDGTVYRTLKARDLWDKIMRATYAYAEPGVIFIDRINTRNNLAYCETIYATNPCVTADTWVQTAKGARQVRDLVGVPFQARVDGVDHASGPQGFFSTGEKPVVRLTTREGLALMLTRDHRVRTVTRRTRWNTESTWREAGSLVPGDEVVLHNHRAQYHWDGPRSHAEGYLIGLLIGDGTLKADKAVLSAWPGALVANGGRERPGVSAVMAAAEAAARTLPHRADFAGWTEVPVRGECRMALGALKTLATDLGLSPGQKTITPDVERGSSNFVRGVLRGVFDADGSVQGQQNKGVSIRLAQSDLALLQAVQRLLLRLGIVSSIYPDRRVAGEAMLPDGKGGIAAYPTKAQHELVITGDNLPLFAERIGFADSVKAIRLQHTLQSYRRALNRTPFVATVEALEDAGTAPVFDVQVPGVNAFDANGIYVHNCGEQPLPPYGACLLGSVNLTRFVRNPFQDAAALDEAALAHTVRMAVRMMDNVVDVSRFPLAAQTNEAKAKRRIGLGVTGLADALILCGLRYGSKRSLDQIEQWMKLVQREAYLASVELAKEKGAFPLYDREAYLASPTIQEMDADVRDAIAEHGIRNALVTSIAPTGTISLFADNVSSGLEPVFSFSYTRKVLMPDGSRAEEEVSDYAYRLFRDMYGPNATLPEYFVSALTLAPEDHVRVQAAVQKYVDSSISKTINCPEDMDFEAFKSVYMQAYESGCKGCTTYRPNDITGSVLEVKKEEKPAADEQPSLPLDDAKKPRAADIYEAGGVVYMTRPLDRPEVLPGKTYKVKWPDSEHAMYITINDIVRDGRRRPFEVFVNSKSNEHYAWTMALTRMISAVFRRGGDVSFVVEELKAVFDPRGGQWMRGRYVPSLLAAIGEVIEEHLVSIGFMDAPDNSLLEAARAKLAVGAESAEPRAIGKTCPKCGSPTLIKQEGCDTCLSCGYSKCG